jgi:hypothetical protein
LDSSTANRRVVPVLAVVVAVANSSGGAWIEVWVVATFGSNNTEEEDSIVFGLVE